MHRINKNFRFPLGHRLSKHSGLCKNIHGHNFKLQVGLKCEELNDMDMVIDFSDLKKIVNKLIVDPLDHAIMLNSKDDIQTYNKIVQIQEANKIFSMECDPTAEKMAEWIFTTLEAEFKNSKIDVDYIRLWENDDSVAEFSRT